MKKVFPPERTTAYAEDIRKTEVFFDANECEIGEVSVVRALAHLKRITARGMVGIPATVLKITSGSSAQKHKDEGRNAQDER